MPQVFDSKQNVAFRASHLQALKDWNEVCGNKLTEDEMTTLSFYLTQTSKTLHERLLGEHKTKITKSVKNTRGVNANRWVRLKLDDYYLIGNLPKKQALLIRPNQISIHSLDAPTWQKNVALAKQLISFPNSNWLWLDNPSKDYTYWRHLMNRWNAYADKTTPVTNLRITNN